MKTWKILIALFAVLVPGLACADLEALKQDAMSGKVDSQLELGMLYEFGYRYPDHDVDALAWYAIAADNGNKLAGERRAVIEGRLSPALREAARARANELRALMPPQPAPQDAPAESGDETPGAAAAETPAPTPGAVAAETAEPNSAPIEISMPTAMP